MEDFVRVRTAIRNVLKEIVPIISILPGGFSDIRQ
jgi:hypothetical protein